MIQNDDWMGHVWFSTIESEIHLGIIIHWFLPSSFSTVVEEKVISKEQIKPIEAFNGKEFAFWQQQQKIIIIITVTKVLFFKSIL